MIELFSYFYSFIGSEKSRFSSATEQVNVDSVQSALHQLLHMLSVELATL